MAERVRTDEERQSRKELLKNLGVANGELAATIPDKCRGCEGVIIRAFVLADRVAREAMTIKQARTNLANDTGECEGTIEQAGVYDGRAICWRVQKLGRTGLLRGQSAFTE